MSTVAIKEKPILMSGSMVRATLRDIDPKGQTRRVVTARNSYRQASPSNWPFDLDIAWRDPGFPHLHNGHKAEYLHVPFCHPEDGWEKDPSDDTVERWYCRWQPGDRLWVKETFLLRNSGNSVVYKADMGSVELAGFGSMYGGWRPSIFMRRQYSRLTLEITDVRVERLQEISNDDAEAEGIDDAWLVKHQLASDQRVIAFRELWDSINGKKHPWKSNPWVWAISFKRVE